MSDQLRLENVRNVLVRLEETILFALIERAQFFVNRAIYEPGRFGAFLEGKSLVGYLLHDCERSHAKVRRYTSPDEHPFYSELPAPVLPALAYENPLAQNCVNLNAQIRLDYERQIVPHICRDGDDRQYGSSAVCDVACLQALSKRIHYGKFVAESKYRATPGVFRPLIAACDREALLAKITDEPVERQVIERVGQKARIHTQDLASTSATPVVDPQDIVDVYRRWIIPLSKDVQVLYLLGR